MRLSGGTYQLSSFAELEQFTNFIASRLSSSTSESPFGAIELSYTRLILAAYAIGETDSKLFYGFLSNRYFLDACGIGQMPDEDELQTWLTSHGNILNAALRALLPGAGPTSDLLTDIVRCLVDFWYADDDRLGALQFYGPTVREKLLRDGYCIIPGVFDPGLCAETRQDLLDIAANERARQKAYHYGKGNRFQRVYNVITKAPSFWRFLAHPLVRVVMDDMFDRQTLHDKCHISSFHANLIPPQGESQKLHVDAAVPDPLPPWIIRANINFLLEDYEFSNGATLCIPGSHLWGRKPAPDDQARYTDQLRPIEGTAGSMVVWHGHLWHQSGHNRSSGDRVALLACFAASFMLEMALEENHFRIMPEEFVRQLPGDLNRLFGWNHGIKLGAH